MNFTTKLRARRRTDRTTAAKELKKLLAGSFVPANTLGNRALRRANGERGKGIHMLPVEHEQPTTAANIDYTAEMAERITKVVNRAKLRGIIRDAAIAEAAKLPGTIQQFRAAGMKLGQLLQLRRIVLSAAAGNVKQLRVYASIMKSREADAHPDCGEALTQKDELNEHAVMMTRIKDGSFGAPVIIDAHGNLTPGALATAYAACAGIDPAQRQQYVNACMAHLTTLVSVEDTDAVMKAVRRELARTPSERFTAQTMRAAARCESYEDFRREARQLDLECEVEELTQAVLDNSELFVDSQGRVFTEEDALELDELSRPVIHIPGSTFAGDEPAPIENSAEAQQVEAFSPADQTAAGSVAHEKGGQHMSENNAIAQELMGCVQVPEIFGWGAGECHGFLSDALKGCFQIEDRYSLPSYTAAILNEMPKQRTLLATGTPFRASMRYTDCRLTPAKVEALTGMTGIMTDGHVEKRILRVTHRIAQKDVLPRPDDEVMACATGEQKAGYFAACEQFTRLLCDRMIRCGFVVKGRDGDIYYKAYTASASAQKEGTLTALEREFFLAHLDVLYWGRTEADFCRAGINGSELLKLTALMQTPSVPFDQVGVKTISLNNTAIVFNPNKDITLPVAYYVTKTGKVVKKTNVSYKQCLFDGMSVVLMSKEEFESCQFRSLLPMKGMMICIGSIQELREMGFAIQDEIDVWDRWDDSGKPVMRKMKVEDIKIILTESCIKGLKLWKSMQDIKDFVRAHGEETFFRLVRAVEAIKDDEFDNERRQASRSMMLAMLCGYGFEFNKLAARSVRRTERFFDQEKLWKLMAENGKPWAEKTGMGKLVAAAGKAILGIQTKNGGKFFQALANDMFLTQIRMSAIAPTLGGVDGSKCEYRYIVHDPVAFVQFYLEGKPLDECGFLGKHEMGAPGFKDGEEIAFARHPLNAAQQSVCTVKNHPLYQNCGNVYVLSINDDVINRADGDFDGDEGSGTNDPLYVKMIKRMLKRLGCFTIVFEHDKSDKYAVKIPEGRSIMLGILQDGHGTPVWKSVSDAIYNGMKYNLVGRYANYAAKILADIDAVELAIVAAKDNDAAIKKLEEEHHYLRAVLCHVITILVIDLMKTGIKPKEHMDAVKDFAKEYEYMPFTQRFVKGSTKPTHIDQETGAELPEPGYAYPFWNIRWDDETMPPRNNAGDIYATSFLHQLRRVLWESFKVTFDGKFLDSVARYQTFVGELAGEIPQYDFRLMYDRETFVDACKWNKENGKLHGLTFPQFRKTALHDSPEKTKLLKLLMGRGIAHTEDKQLIETIKKSKPFSIGDLIKFLYHQKAKLAMELSQKEMRNADARIDINIQTKVALDVIRVWLSLEDKDGHLFQPWLEQYRGADGKLDDRALKCLANYMIRQQFMSNGKVEDGRHGLFAFTLDLFGEIWAKAVLQNAVTPWNPDDPVPSDKTIESEEEAEARDAMGAPELQYDYVPPVNTEYVPEIPDLPPEDLGTVPEAPKDHQLTEQPAPEAQAVSHTTNNMTNDTTEGGTTMKTLTITVITTDKKYTNLPALDIAQAVAIAKTHGETMGFVADNGDKFDAFVSPVATKELAEKLKSCLAPYYKAGKPYEPWGPGKKSSNQTQTPPAEQAAPQQAAVTKDDLVLRFRAGKTIAPSMIKKDDFVLALAVDPYFKDYALFSSKLDWLLSKVKRRIVIASSHQYDIAQKYAAEHGLIGCVMIPKKENGAFTKKTIDDRNRLLVNTATKIVIVWNGEDKGEHAGIPAVLHYAIDLGNRATDTYLYDFALIHRDCVVTPNNKVALGDPRKRSVSQDAREADRAVNVGSGAAMAPAADSMDAVNDKLNSIIDAVRAIDTNHGGQLRKIVGKLDDDGRRNVLALIEKRDTVTLSAMKVGFGTKILASIEQAIIAINAATK